MKTGDLITSYLNNEMNPEQEREFLLSVAASDSLRLALKSHVMLDRIVTRQAQQVHVPEAIRENIFAQMSASMSPASHGAPGGGSAPLSGNGGMGGGGTGLAGRSFWRFGRGAMAMLMTACSFAAGYYAHSQLPGGAAERAPAVQPIKQGEASVAPPAVESPAEPTDAVTGRDVTAAPAETPAEPRQPVRAARQTASSASFVAAPRSTPRVVNASHGVSVTGTRHTQAIDEVNPEEETTVPSGATSKPAAAQQPDRTDPLNPPTNVKPTVTSGAQSTSEMKPTFSDEGTIRDSHGNPQRVLPSPEGTK